MSSKEGLESVISDSHDLISLYIPPNRSSFDVIAQLRTEIGIALNIKDDVVKDHIVTELSMIIERLNRFEKIPDKGVAIFCGHYGKDNAVRLTTIQPPDKPISFNLYRCNNHFTVRDGLK